MFNKLRFTAFFTCSFVVLIVFAKIYNSDLPGKVEQIRTIYCMAGEDSSDFGLDNICPTIANNITLHYGNCSAFIAPTRAEVFREAVGCSKAPKFDLFVSTIFAATLFSLLRFGLQRLAKLLLDGEFEYDDDDIAFLQRHFIRFSDKNNNLVHPFQRSRQFD